MQVGDRRADAASNKKELTEATLQAIHCAQEIQNMIAASQYALSPYSSLSPLSLHSSFLVLCRSTNYYCRVFDGFDTINLGMRVQIGIFHHHFFSPLLPFLVTLTLSSIFLIIIIFFFFLNYRGGRGSRNTFRRKRREVVHYSWRRCE